MSCALSLRRSSATSLGLSLGAIVGGVTTGVAWGSAFRGRPTGLPASLSHGVPWQFFTKSPPGPVSPSLSWTHTLTRPKEMFVGVQDFSEPYSANKPCVCTTLSDFTPHLSSRRHGYTEKSCFRELQDFNLVRFPKTIFERCLLVSFHMVPFKQPSCVLNNPWPNIQGGRYLCRETCFELKSQAPDSSFHRILCSSHCTDALAAESRCCFGFQLGCHLRWVSARSYQGVSSALARDPLWGLLSRTDFVGIAALIGFWAPTSTSTRVVAHAWFPGWCRHFGSWRR